MCDYVAWEDSFSLQFVPDWFVTQQQLKIWHDYDDYYDDDKLIKWCEGYQKRKAQKAKIREELLLVAWHPDRDRLVYVTRREKVVEVTDSCFKNYLTRKSPPVHKI